MDQELYTEQLGFYFLANGVTEAKTKKSVLLTNLSVETYQLTKNLVAPTQLKMTPLCMLSQGNEYRSNSNLKGQLWFTRYEFDNRAGNSGESVNYHVAILKHLAAECKFGEAMRTERLRDRVLSSIRDSEMITEILKVKLADLSFENYFSMGRKFSRWKLVCKFIIKVAMFSAVSVSELSLLVLLLFSYSVIKFLAGFVLSE